jgi:hypothetical protein
MRERSLRRAWVFDDAERTESRNGRDRLLTELLVEDVAHHGLAAAAAPGRAGARAHCLHAGRAVADAGADGSVTDGSTMANNHDPPNLTLLKTTFNITCNNGAIPLEIKPKVGQAAARPLAGGR